MEKSLEDSLSYMKGLFQLKDVDLRTYSPLTLAYIGDGIYELIIRTLLVGQGNNQANKLHKRASQLVKAQTQSSMIEVLLDELSDEELHIYKRGRNAKSVTMAKNATMAEYRRATGFEALMGYLYLNNDLYRMMDLIKIALEKTGEKL